MRYGILSDIHGNLEALKVALKLCEELTVDKYICLGDLVGYNANPQECVDIVRKLPGLIMVKGNHDEYISNGDDEMLGFNPHAKKAVLWTREKLNEESLKWLSKLPYVQVIKGGINGGITLVHATLDSPDTWGYVFDIHHAKDCFSYQMSQICFCGHSHSPLAFTRLPAFMRNEDTPEVAEIREWICADTTNMEVDITQIEQICLPIKPNFKYLLNVGSVGQPRNHDPRASFAVFDTEEKVILRVCAPYDIATTQKKILDAGLPERLAHRLAHGA